MSKERLEEIEKNLDPLGYGMGGHLISVNDIYWLVKYAKEQAERVQEWRDIAKWQNDEKLKMEKIALEYEKQNKRYREVINNINEKAMLYGVDEEVYEAIQEAIRTLESEE